jgi:hypothetical protein
MKNAVTVAATVALTLFALCEVILAFPVSGWLYLLLVPLFGFGLVRRHAPRTQFGRLGVFGAIVAAIAVLYFVRWTSRKPFLRDLYSVRPGMSEADARQIMARYVEGTGWPAVYDGAPSGTGTLTDLGTGATHVTGTTPTGEMTILSSLVFRHSTDGAFNSDWGIITLKDGRVTNVSFSPD